MTNFPEKPEHLPATPTRGAMYLGKGGTFEVGAGSCPTWQIKDGESTWVKTPAVANFTPDPDTHYLDSGFLNSRNDIKRITASIKDWADKYHPLAKECMEFYALEQVVNIALSRLIYEKIPFILECVELLKTAPIQNDGCFQYNDMDCRAYVRGNSLYHVDQNYYYRFNIQKLWEDNYSVKIHRLPVDYDNWDYDDFTNNIPEKFKNAARYDSIEEGFIGESTDALGYVRKASSVDKVKMALFQIDTLYCALTHPEE